jgi:hypothetical protein
MEQVPGVDGYLGYINDTLFNDVAYPYFGKYEAPLNVARYHRWFKVAKSGALGRKTRHRGFSDENLFMAQTTDPQVAGMTLKSCKGKRIFSRVSEVYIK